MRTVFLREAAELSLVTLTLLLFAVLQGIDSVRDQMPFDELVTAAIVGGAALGLLQGGLDRWRRGDLFWKHRPVGALPFEAVRTLAGVLSLAVAAAGLLVTRSIATAVEIAEREAALERLGDLPRQLSATECAALLGVALAAWASVRYAVCRKPVLLVGLYCAAIPMAGWAWLSRLSTQGFAAGMALIVAGAFTVLQTLDCAEDRG